jgi:tetratricopeptide (TPR) repeat protein/predicted Ser/Thr protein kinase
VSGGDIDRTGRSDGDWLGRTVAADTGASLPASVKAAPARVRVDAPTLARGDLVGRYLVLGVIGQGGMGVVYAAHDPELDRKVALKLVLACRDDDPAAHARLLREAQALAQLSHPNVVTIFDVGTLGDRVWLAMEFVEGVTLDVWLEQKRRSWQEIVAVFACAGEGLQRAHAAGLVHRDFKPENVMVDPEGRVRVMDFGLARAEQLPGGSSAEPGLADGGLTRADAVLGTPLYMAPEQWSRAPVDARADQFAFCVALWAAVYGEPPFRGDTLPALADAVTHGRIDVGRRALQVAPWLRRVLLRGLARDPDGRFTSMAELLRALERGKAGARRRRWLLAGAAALVVVVAVLAWRHHDAGARAAACDDAGAEIADTWNDRAGQDLRAKVLATGAPYAATTADRVGPWLDAWTEQWATTRAQVCREELAGTRTPEHHALAAACLDERRDELVAVLAALREADASVLTHAVPAVAGLSLLAPCSERAALERRPAPPTDDAARLRVQALRRDLMRVQGLFSAGRYDDGLTRAQALLTAAESEGYPPLIAEAGVVVGRLANQTGDFALAERALERAFTDGGAIGADETAATAALELVYAIGYGVQHHAEALQWARAAEMLIRRIGQERGLLGATLLNNRGVVLAMRGSHDEARESLERAIEVRLAVLGPRHPRGIDSLGNLGEILRMRGDLARAAEVQRQVLEQCEAVYGPDHPDTAVALNNLAITYNDLNEPTKALPLLERALAVWQAALGPLHVNVANALTNLGNTRAMLGDYVEALDDNARALAVWETVAGPEHPRYSFALATRAVILGRSGDLAGAHALLMRSLAVQEKALGVDSPDVAATLVNLATLDMDRGANAEALPLLERARAIEERALPPDHPRIALTLARLGELLVRLDRPFDAMPLLERAVTALAADATPTNRANARFALARALPPTEHARARRLALDAVEAYRGAGEAALLESVEAWLRAHP